MHWQYNGMGIMTSLSQMLLQFASITKSDIRPGPARVPTVCNPSLPNST